MSEAACFIFGCVLSAAMWLPDYKWRAALLGRGWLWDWQDEGCEVDRVYYGVAWDEMTYGYNYRIRLLVAVIPLNFVIRALMLMRWYAWKYMWFAPSAARDPRKRYKR